MMKLAGIKPWWFVVIAVTIFAGCHGGGGSSVPSLPAGAPGAPSIPRTAMSQAANPVPTITPSTLCTKTRDSNNNDNGPNYVCFVEGGATSNQMTLGPVHPDTWDTCSAGTYSFIPISGGTQPPTALPSPTVSYDPSQSTAGNCTTKEDSTTITINFPSPLPQGRWAAPWVVREDFQFYAGGQWYGDHKDLGQVWLHPGLRIIDNDNSGSEIQNSTWERVVGQRVNISADHPYDDETVSSCNWAVPNGITPYAVGSYGSLTGSTPPSTMPSPSPMPTTAATALTYYWAQPFDATQQNVTCSVSNSSGNGEGGPALPATQISAILNPYVVAPTINTLSATFGTIHQGQWDPNSSLEHVSLGTLMSPPPSLGLQSTYTITMPSDYGGTWGPSQTVAATTVVSPQPSTPPADTGGATWLDDCAIFTNYYNGSDLTGPGTVPTTSAGAQGSISTADSPSSISDPTFTMIHETDNFVTTLMFKPKTGPGGATLSNTIWVPLAAYGWNFDGEAVDNSPWAWATSPAPTQSPAPGAYSLSANPSLFSVPGNFPTWSGRLAGPSCATVP